MSAGVEQIMAQIEALTAEERRQVPARLDGESDSPPSTASERELRLMEHLLARGVIARIPDRYRGGDNRGGDSDLRPPLEAQGRPVSETLLEDRGQK
jgi:hypothetical protein